MTRAALLLGSRALTLLALLVGYLAVPAVLVAMAAGVGVLLAQAIGKAF